MDQPSLTIKGHSTQPMRIYQVLRIGNNVNDPTLDFCLEDKTLCKLHATLTLYEKGIFLVNESRHGGVWVNGRGVGGPVHLTERDSFGGLINLRFGRTDAQLRFFGGLAA
ncbi:hypothetical protein KR018_010566 [Drosophila ironensis]|nr:hypothetical protein KR018_010566 [Drosophila ironensis]